MLKIHGTNHVNLKWCERAQENRKLLRAVCCVLWQCMYCKYVSLAVARPACINCIKPSENYDYNILLNCNFRLISNKARANSCGMRNANTQRRWWGCAAAVHLLLVFCLFVWLFHIYCIYVHLIRARCVCTLRRSWLCVCRRYITLASCCHLSPSDSIRSRSFCSSSE